MKYLLLTLVTLSIFAGCTTKKINSNVDSITGDVQKVFDDGVDKSAK
jgi:hypothetical protein